MLNNIKNSRYLIGIICAFIAGGFFLFLQSTFSQTIFKNTIDLLNLEQVRPDITGAYLTPDKMGFKETWKLLNDNPLIPLAPVKIGIIDTRIDGTHPEFRGVDFGDTDEVALTLPIIFRTPHGTAVAGIIGANNISAASSLAVGPKAVSLVRIQQGLPNTISGATIMAYQKFQTGGDIIVIGDTQGFDDFTFSDPFHDGTGDIIPFADNLATAP